MPLFFFFLWGQILSLTDGQRITSVIPVSDFAGDQFLLMLTMNGYIKKVSLNSFSSIRSTGIIAIQLVCSLLFCFILACWSTIPYVILFPGLIH